MVYPLHHAREYIIGYMDKPLAFYHRVLSFDKGLNKIVPCLFEAKAAYIDIRLTLHAQMDSSFRFDTIYLGCSIVYINFNFQAELR